MHLEYQANERIIKKWYNDWHKNKVNKPLLIFGDFASTLQTLTQEGQIYKLHIYYQKKELKMFFDKFLSTQAAIDVPVIFGFDHYPNRMTRSFKYFENRFIVLLNDTSSSLSQSQKSQQCDSYNKTICHII